MKEISILIFNLLVLISFNLCIKIYPRRDIKMYGDDSWGIMLWADFFREKLPKKEFCRFLLSGEKFYGPEFLSKLLSFFNQNFVLRFNWIFSPFFDSITLLLLFLFSSYIFGNSLIAFIAGLIYILFAPLVFYALSLNSRSLGYLLFNFSAVSCLLGYFYKNPFWAVAAVFFGGLLLNTHKMSTQALIFLFLGLSILEWNLFFIGILLLSFLSALVISKGYYLRLLEGHLKTIKTHLLSLRRSPYDRLSFNALLPKFFFLGAIIVFIYYALRGINISVMSLLFKWLLIMYIISLSVSFMRIFHCIGQGYRYIEFAVVPISLLFAYALSLTRYKILGIILFIFYFLYSSKKIAEHFQNMKKDYINIVDDDRLIVFKFIKESHLLNIFCISNGMSQCTAYFTGKKVLWTYYDWDNFAWLFPHLAFPLKVDLNQIIKRYNLDAILLDTRFVSIEQLRLSNYKLAFSKGCYRLLQVC